MESRNANSVDVLAERLAGSTKIESKISFKDQQLQVLEGEAAKPIVEALENAESVDALELSGNTLGINGAKEIAVALEKRPELKRALWSDMFTGRSKEELPPALKSLCDAMLKAGVHLVELDLSDNAFGPNGAVSLKDFFRSSAVYSLQILKLNNNGLGPTGGEMIANSLSSCYDDSVKAGTPLAIKVFVSGRGRLEDVGATAFSKVLEKMGSLEEITMPQNGIRYEGIQSLAKCFAKNLNLRILNLEDNTVATKGAKAIAEVLPKLRKLEVLNLNDCLCRATGVQFLLDVLTRNCSLRELHLNGNEIPAQLGLELLESLGKHKNLEILELCANNFGSNLNAVKDCSGTCGIQSVDLGTVSDDQGSLSSEGEGSGVSGDEGHEENGAVYDSEENWIDDEEEEGVEYCEETSSTLVHTTSTQRLEVSLPSSPRSDVQRALTELADDFDDPEAVARSFLEISSTVTRRNSFKTLELAQQTCDTVLKKGFQCIKPPSMLLNCLIARMGLIKSEEENSVPDNLYGPLRVMEYIVTQPYFTKPCRDVLSFVLGRSKFSFHGIEDAKKSLEEGLQSLT